MLNIIIYYSILLLLLGSVKLAMTLKFYSSGNNNKCHEYVSCIFVCLCWGYILIYTHSSVFSCVSLIMSCTLRRGRERGGLS